VVFTQGGTKRWGKEAELVDRFLASYLPLYTPQNDITVLIEPNLGFAEPDVVLIEWDSSAWASLPRERATLSKNDLRLLAHLLTTAPTTLSALRLPFPRIHRSDVLRLVHAGLVELAQDQSILPLGPAALAVRSIVALEAKLALSSRAIEQAFRNKLFASVSYVVTSSHNPSPRSLEHAASFGLGVYTCPQSRSLSTLVPPVRSPIAVSFHTLYVQELAWRAMSPQNHVH
jgi:hypothetical protein